jgi:hypothetical protein
VKLYSKIAIVLGAMALIAAPASAMASKTENPGKGHEHGNQGPSYEPAEPPVGTPGPGAGLPAKAKAYGVYCKAESRKHVKGEKGTAFSRCVTAMAKAARHDSLSPGQACKGMSRKHVKGEKGTAFSRCVTAAAKLRRQSDDQG